MNVTDLKTAIEVLRCIITLMIALIKLFDCMKKTVMAKPHN